LPDEQVDHMKELFDVMDTNKNGDLTFEESKHGLHKYGQQVADPDVQMLMDAVRSPIQQLSTICFGHGLCFLLPCRRIVCCEVHDFA